MGLAHNEMLVAWQHLETVTVETIHVSSSCYMECTECLSPRCTPTLYGLATWLNLGHCDLHGGHQRSKHLPLEYMWIWLLAQDKSTLTRLRVHMWSVDTLSDWFLSNIKLGRRDLVRVFYRAKFTFPMYSNWNKICLKLDGFLLQHVDLDITHITLEAPFSDKWKLSVMTIWF